MRSCCLAIAILLLVGCDAEKPEFNQFSKAQSASGFGSTNTWHIDPALNSVNIQKMRDRAYYFCHDRKNDDRTCYVDQDQSIFGYINAFNLVRTFRGEKPPIEGFVAAHQRNRKSFQRIRNYCEGVYKDQGSADARSLGPCMAAGMGSDYFSIVPVP
ncbi:hypothetical protein [Sphingomonas paucimobilis]|uniref:hypothetical protein n=1 Tax=Sphingomonas paucimobilis TaxID=13689 RepID=UPI0028D1A092|nr:hypothetical protein [Sphingomonas paucimobilis]